MAKQRRRFSHFLKWFLICSMIIVIGLTATFVITTYNMDYAMPQIANVELYDSAGEKYLSYSNSRKQSYVKLDAVSPYITKAFISIEDKRFYDHHGIDIIRIGGALLANLKSNGITEGGSTITQQYIRTIFLSNEKNWRRKLTEAMIAMNFERKYSKEEILEGYLNAIYFDHGIYGVEDASIYYFGKHAKDLTLMEACIIASIPKGPTIYSPIRHPEKNKVRRELILAEMKSDGVISAADYQNALAEEIKFVGYNPKTDSENAPFFQDMVIEELKRIPQIQDIAHQGLKVYTTLDNDLYQTIIHSMANRMPTTGIEAAVYVMEPSTGKVLAAVGGKDYNESTYNRAVTSLRQPGSAIKPFLYLSALEKGFTPATTFMSEPTTFYINNQAYAPTNFKSIYANMNISMVYAIATSDNIYAMKTHLFLGTSVLAHTLKRFHFPGEIPNLPSLALGTHEVSVQALAQGYAAIANLGVRVEPTLITKITTFDGEVVYEANPKKERLCDEIDAYLLNEAMTSVFDNGITYNIRPTGASIASMLHHTYSGKSGSTDTDNWMVGYNPDILAVVWTGYDDNRDVESVEDTKFGKYIWADTVEGYYRNHGSIGSWYEKPQDAIGVELNPMTGFYPSFEEYYKTIYFKKSNVPWFIQLLY